MKGFLDHQKQDMKLLKQEVDMMPKEIRRDAFRRKKEEKEIEQEEKVRNSVF